MKFTHPALFFALLALPVVAGGDRLPDQPAAPDPATMPAFAAGQILNLDPAGKFTPAQHAADVQLLLGDVASQSQEGLVEESSPVKGGGIMVNLQGRFQNAMTMSVDANGQTAAPCVPAAEAPAKKVK
jgi:hypothetical protein